MKQLTLCVVLATVAGCATTPTPESPRAAEGLIEVNVELFGLE